MTFQRTLCGTLLALVSTLLLSGCYVPKHVPYNGEPEGQATPAPRTGPTAAQVRGQTTSQTTETTTVTDGEGTTTTSRTKTVTTPAMVSPSRLFGVTVRASHIVYVVDRSDSTAKHWNFIRDNVNTAIGDMWSDQDFALILMGDAKPFIAPGRTLIPVAKHDQAMALDLLVQTECGGKTDPAAALKMAFSVLNAASERPGKVIYFVTDRAYLDPATVELVETLNRKGDVHMMTFMIGEGSGETARLLDAMAKATGGKYKAVEPQ